MTVLSSTNSLEFWQGNLFSDPIEHDLNGRACFDVLVFNIHKAGDHSGAFIQFNNGDVIRQVFLESAIVTLVDDDP